MTQAKLKEERIHIRLNSFSKKRIERAAALSGKTVTEFVVSTAVSKADQVIDEHERISLGAEDWEVFMEAILNPPKPNKALRDAMAAHKRISSSSPRRKK